MTLYSILDKSARSWWYHRELRERGNPVEARKRERQDIRSSAKTLRDCLASGGWCSIGRGGWDIHYSHMMCKSNCNTTLSGYGGLDAPMPKACLMLGIPVLDTTAISDNLIMQSISFPMATNGQPDESPWGSMSYAPLDYVAGLYAAIGATVYNLEISRPNVAKLRRNTDREDDCLIGYLTGDQERLGKGIIGAFSETIAK